MRGLLAASLAGAFDFFLHVDRYLDTLLAQYGTWTYGILCLVVFLETGVVVTPFLPGDSLLFAAGVFAARGALDPHLLFLFLTTAAVVGDNTNYWLGRWFGKRVLASRLSRFIRQEHLDRTHAFYERYGARTVFIARFVPFVRTFAPFVAGVGVMDYSRFLTFSVLGGCVWVGTFVYAGYFLGNVPLVRDNFEIAVMLIIGSTILPAIWVWARNKWRARRGSP